MRYRTSVGLFLLFTLIALLFGCADEPTTGPSEQESAEPAANETMQHTAEGEPPVAWINGTPVDRQTFEDATAAMMNQYGQTYAGFSIDISGMRGGASGRVFDLAVEADAFLQIVQQVLTQQEAAQRGISISDDEVGREMQAQYEAYLASQGWSEADLMVVLAEQGRTLASFKAEARKHIADQLLAAAVQRAVAGPMEITDDEVREYFDEHRDEYGASEFADVADQVRLDLESETSYNAAVEWYDSVFEAATLEFSDPVLEAGVRQMDDLDGAIAVLEKAQAEGTSDDVYLPYVLGTLYEKKLDLLEAAQAEEDGAALDAQIESYRTRALEAFQAAQEALPEDPSVDSKVTEFSGVSP